MKKGFISSLFSNVDADKAACAQWLISQIQTCDNAMLNTDNKRPPLIGIECFNLFKDTLYAIKNNEDIAKVKKTSLGQLSKILNNFSMQFFAMTFNDVNQTNDITMINEFKKYEERCIIKPAGFEDSTENKTTAIAFKLN